MQAAQSGSDDELLRRHRFDGATFQAARALVREWAVEAGADPDGAESFTYAVNEGLTNAVAHGGGGGQLTLRRTAGARLVAVVEDRRPVPAFPIPATPPAAEVIGGRGLWLAAQLCSAVTVEEGVHGTRLVLEFDLAASAEVDAPTDPVPPALR